MSGLVEQRKEEQLVALARKGLEVTMRLTWASLLAGVVEAEAVEIANLGGIEKEQLPFKGFGEDARLRRDNGRWRGKGVDGRNGWRRGARNTGMRR